ncbi:gamma-glutamyltransferase [Pelagibius sp. 7325]|uniref:gamma-glutamyltransferase n=1 Tax=Pelagibius sp. 7325 TaxID=3131994 RepID=UPI0030EEAA02
MTALAACDGVREPGVLAPVEGFAGLVAGDEPRAVTIGRDVLGNGGTAADAAVAMYFTMTVTLPSRVGIAGGGACLAHNSGLGFQEGDPFDEAYLFLPDPAAPGRPQLAGPRAMAVLHARHGAQRWELLLSDAERLARVGTGASRAFVTDLDAAATFVSASPDLKAAFSNRAGTLASEGDEIVRAELSGLISGLRRQGAGYLYTGAFANRFVEAANGIGLPLTVQDLRETVPTVTAPLAVPYGDNVAYFPPLPGSGGLLTAQMWGMLTEVENYSGAGPAERAHLLAEAGQRAFAARGGWLGGRGNADGGNADGGNAGSGGELVSEAALERLMAGYSARQHTPTAAGAAAVPAVSNPFTAGFVVADAWGSVVTCSFTMSGLFGDGRTVPGTGVILPKVAVPGADNLSTAIIGNPFNGTVYFAGTASGGLAAPAALTRVMLDSVEGGGDLQAAVAAPRVVNVGSPDVTYHEPTLDPAVLAGLRERGHDLRAESGVGRANALFCPEGLRVAPGGCLVETDKRGHGLAVVAQ